MGRRRFVVDDQRLVGRQAFEALLDVVLEPVLAIVTITLVVGIDLVLRIHRLSDALAGRIPHGARNRGIIHLHVWCKSTTHATQACLLERYTQPALHEFARRFNVAPDQRAAVSLDGATRAVRWGLLAPWRGHGGMRPPPIRTAAQNAIALTPVLANARRCLVHADGWYAKARIGKAIHAWWIHGAVTVAGLVATHKDDGIESFMIVTRLPPVALVSFTEVLPVGADAAWLAGGAPIEIAWRATEISRYFEDVSHDDERCIAPLRNPGQGSLF